MSATLTQTISEYLVLLLDTVRRRWRIAALIILVALPVAIVAGKMSSARYTAKSLILLHADSGNTTPQSRQVMMEQVAAIEAWVKSDHIMRELLPQIMEGAEISDPQALSVLLDIARSSINFTLLGGSALEISLDAEKPEGLGQKLEIILARIMEGLSGPNRGILSAPQFAVLKRKEAVEQQKQALEREIEQSGAGAAAIIESRLDALQDLDMSIRLNRRNGGGANAAGELADLTKRKQEIEQQIADDPSVRARILGQYDAYRTAIADYEELEAQISPQSKNYFGVLDASGVVVVGRPQDPVFGNSPAKKIAIAILFLGIVAAGGVVVVMELFFPGVRLRSEFETLSGLPVISRFQDASQVKSDYREVIRKRIHRSKKYITLKYNALINYKRNFIK
jgi:capsular polysaccharide biosynthesis protein